MTILGGRRFADDDELKEAVHDWLQTQRKMLFIMASESLWTVGKSALRLRKTT
jgi:hypothetical protein